MLATTANDLYGNSGSRQRRTVLMGLPFSTTATRAGLSIQQKGFHNYASMYRLHSNAMSAVNPSQTQNLPDEVPIEVRGPQQFHWNNESAYIRRFHYNRYGDGNMTKGKSQTAISESVPMIETTSKGCMNRKWISIELKYSRFGRKTGILYRETVEQLGSFDPVPNRWGMKVCGLNVERIKYWLACGARVSTGAANILGLAGITPISPDTVFRADKLKEREKIEAQATDYVHRNLKE